jgi:Chain length determinant protein
MCWLRERPTGELDRPDAQPDDLLLAKVALRRQLPPWRSARRARGLPGQSRVHLDRERYTWLLWREQHPLLLSYLYFLWVGWCSNVALVNMRMDDIGVAALSVCVAFVVIAVVMTIDPISVPGSADMVFLLLGITEGGRPKTSHGHRGPGHGRPARRAVQAEHRLDDVRNLRHLCIFESQSSGDDASSPWRRRAWRGAVPPSGNGTALALVRSRRGMILMQDSAVSETGSVDLRDLLSLLWKEKWTIAALTASVLFGAIAYSLLETQPTSPR